MANTYVAINTITVGSGGAANIEFTSIPSTYTDLCLLFSLRSVGGTTYRGVLVTVNGATSGHNYRILSGEGSGTPSSSAETNVAYIYGYESGGGATASSFGNGYLYIPNYANTSRAKSISMDTVSESDTTAMTMGMTAGLYDSSTAITSIRLKTSVVENLAQYSTATLYGIKSS